MQFPRLGQAQFSRDKRSFSCDIRVVRHITSAAAMQTWKDAFLGATKVRTPTRSKDAQSRRTRRRWVGPYLFVTALVVPLVYSNATIDPVLLPRFLIVSLLGIVMITAFGVGIVRSTTTLSVNRAEAIVIGCLIVYILVAAISVLIAGPTPDGKFELLKVATLTWLIYASSRAIDGERSTLTLLAKLVIMGSLLVGGFGILQYYQVALFEWMKRDITVDSTMAHRNLLASFLILAFPFVAYAFLELNGRWRVASAAAILISIFLLVALQTRSAWVAFPLGLAFSLIVLAVVTKRARPTRDRRRPYRGRLIQGTVLTALGLSIALLFYSPGARAPMRDHVGSLVQLRHASIQERLQLWTRTIRMIREHPLTGVGLGNWRVVVPKYGTEGLRSDKGTLHFQRPHNDFLWAASETGLLGGVLYIAVFMTVLGLAVSAMARAPSMHDRVVLALMLLGVSCYVLVSVFSFPKERIAHSVYLALLIGTVLSFHRDAGGRPAAWAFSKRWTMAIVVLVWIVTLIAGRFALPRYNAEVHLRRAFEARAVKNWPLMLTHLDRIDRRYYIMDPTSTPVAWYRGVAHFEMGEAAAALADFRSALEVHPNHVHVLNNIATCHTLRGEHDDAVRTYKRAIAIASRFEEARINLGFLLHSLGRDEEAYEVLAPSAGYATSPRFRECFRLVKTALGLEN
jgi:O-antigen ligase